MTKSSRLHIDLAVCFAKIESLFEPSAKVTLVVRTFGPEATGIVMGDDDLAEVIEEIRARMEQDDVCEHNIKLGDWCLLCNQDYKDAQRSNP